MTLIERVRVSNHFLIHVERAQTLILIVRPSPIYLYLLIFLENHEKRHCCKFANKHTTKISILISLIELMRAGDSQTHKVEYPLNRY